MIREIIELIKLMLLEMKTTNAYLRCLVDKIEKIADKED